MIAALVSGLILISGSGVLAGVETQTLEPGHTFRDCSECPEMVVIPAGSFVMGSSAAETARELASMQSDESEFNKRSLEWERPQHAVSIAQPFGVGKYPVTRGEFAVFVHETGYAPTNDCILNAPHIIHGVRSNWQKPAFNQSDRDPVVCVSWQDANAYVGWLNGKLRGQASTASGGPYRLPSEAEYEYAARGGTQTAYWWGDVIGSGNTVCAGCFGLHDMRGNAWAWMEDCWNENYVGAPTDGRPWTTAKCERHVMRGGAWVSRPWLLRAAHRRPKTLPNNANGFRLARTLP